MALEKDIEKIEIECLLNAINRAYGFDFRDYAQSSLKRRIINRKVEEGFEHISELIPAILHSESAMMRLLNDFSICVTELFRDPKMFLALRTHVIPKLKTYPHINIWCVGCATGEEAYSLAILLQEEGLLKRSRIYATDFNRDSLQTAKKGIFNIEKIIPYENNHAESGGTTSLSDHYVRHKNSILFNSNLREKITFAHHNLIHDGRFAEMHLILCRNVLIYFNQTLQNRVLGVLHDSLVERGHLVLGDKETLHLTPFNDRYESYGTKERIYRKQLCTAQ